MGDSSRKLLFYSSFLWIYLFKTLLYKFFSMCKIVFFVAQTLKKYFLWKIDVRTASDYKLYILYTPPSHYRILAFKIDLSLWKTAKTENNLLTSLYNLYKSLLISMHRGIIHSYIVRRRKIETKKNFKLFLKFVLRCVCLCMCLF